uniref:Uncharacterized protein n=1 Tax=Oryza glumipatula TaxID=40148 RepID=A0A0D9YZU6_9ORYZ
MSVIECKVRFTNTKGNTAARNTEASGVFNRHEGLALLTTIVEGGGNCNPASDPLPNQSLLSASIINKILHLIDALDLLCRRSYIALDQLLLDTQEALKIAYPKCLSGLSAYHNTSSRWGACTGICVTDLVEGGASHLHGGKSSRDKKARASPAAGAKGGGAGHGMADASAEMTKRSAYFRQIEEDVGTHPAAILELRDAVGAFQSMDMGELARFEGFPSKKLEALRMAAALYSKLDGVVATPSILNMQKKNSYFLKNMYIYKGLV